MQYVRFEVMENTSYSNLQSKQIYDKHINKLIHFIGSLETTIATVI